MDIRYSRAGYFSGGTFTGRFVAKSSCVIKAEHCFPHQPSLNFDYAMRTVVIVNWGSLTWAPTDNEHLYRGVSTNTMTPVVTFFKTEVRLKVTLGDLGGREPGANLFQSWRSALFLQLFNEFGERERMSLRGDNFFGVNLCRQ